MRGGLKVLSGSEVIRIFETFGFEVIGGTKHVKMRRTGPGGVQTLIVALHSPIGKGLLRTIYMQASAYIPQEKLRPLFYNE